LVEDLVDRGDRRLIHGSAGKQIVSSRLRIERGKDGIELGAKNYDVNSYLDGEPSVTLGLFQLPGSNALETATAIKQKMQEFLPTSRAKG